mmetsp:Transcript_83879/g.234072  ORF Transcript_83879/g.234072 Transcript_83879/m.234072 type:complete len:406 (+) Transcript_83879:144-1361(+)
MLVRDGVAENDLGNLECQITPWAYTRILIVLAVAKSAIPSKGAAQVRTCGVEDTRVGEDVLVPVRHGHDVLAQAATLEQVSRAGQLHLRVLLERVRGAGDRWVEAARLLHVGYRVHSEGLDHLFDRGVVSEINPVGRALWGRFQLKELAARLHACRCATHPREADDVHDLVAQLDSWLPSVLRGQAVVHVDEDLLQSPLLNNVHCALPQLLHLTDAHVAQDPLEEPWEDERARKRTPTGEHLRLFIADPLAEHHEEDALAHRAAHEGKVVHILERGVGPVRRDQTRKLSLPRFVVDAAQEVVVQSRADRRPLRIRGPGVREENQDVRSEEVRDGCVHASESGLPVLVRPQHLVDFRVPVAPRAKAVVPVCVVAERRPLPHEEAQAAGLVADEGEQGSDGVPPPHK